MATTALTTFTRTTDDAWAITEKSFTFPTAASLANGTYGLITTTEPCTVEFIAASNQTAGTAGTIRVYFAPSGTALASGTALTAAENLDSTNYPANGTTMFSTLTNNTTVIAAGSTIGFVTASTPGTIAGFTMTIGLRKAGYYTNDAGSKFYPQPGPSQIAM